MASAKPVGRPRLETARRAVISVRLDDKQVEASEAVGGAKWLTEVLDKEVKNDSARN